MVAPDSVLSMGQIELNRVFLLIPGSNGNKGVVRIFQSPNIIGTSPSDCLRSYLGHSLGESYPSAEVQSVYSTAPADWAIGQHKCCNERRWLLISHAVYLGMFFKHYASNGFEVKRTSTDSERSVAKKEALHLFKLWFKSSHNSCNRNFLFWDFGEEKKY